MNTKDDTLSEKSVDPNPYRQFEKWYKDRLVDNISIPNSMSLGTASGDGMVSVRSVLLKEYDEKGFVFFTNYNSKKGKHLQANPNAALLFYCPESNRQIRIEGIVCKITEKESELYFKTRPVENRLAAWASEQSSVIPDRKFLENNFDFFRKKFEKKSIDKPPYWGGFRLAPVWFEFWQEGKHRLHDRISYTLEGNIWKIERLAP
jgi:pyridoxamine 5'-phosphate oxidase